MSELNINFDRHRVITGDSLEVLKGMDDNSIDSIITDPPYGLSFMGKKWDHDVPRAELWAEALRVLKPGGHLLSFFGSRTYHRGCVEIEDAGFEIRDQIMWVYGSGFPKSLDVSKAIDKLAGAEREVISDTTDRRNDGSTYGLGHSGKVVSNTPATPEAQTWQGWGTALKPAHEPIVVARKPLEGTVAKNVLKYGTGGINVDGCRVPGENLGVRNRKAGSELGQAQGWNEHTNRDTVYDGTKGRFPANLIHDGDQQVLDLFPGSDDNSAARFFYCAKPSKKERDQGLDHLNEQEFVQWQTGNGASGKPSSMSEGRDTRRKNVHPTVKPIALMEYLCRLITPPGGIVLDPFLGSGTTGIAALNEGFSFIGIEREEEYAEIAEARIRSAYS